jgi:hypothetical protein
MMRGSKFAERMPIGLESIIQGVSAETVKAFYRRWYQPRFMAVVAVGDFEVRVHVTWAAVSVHVNRAAVSVQSWLRAIIPHSPYPGILSHIAGFSSCMLGLLSGTSIQGCQVRWGGCNTM